jgi:hypothetical protein
MLGNENCPVDSFYKEEKKIVVIIGIVRDMNEKVKAILQDPEWTEAEKEWILKFDFKIRENEARFGAQINVDLFQTANELGLNVYYRNIPLVNALLVTLYSNLEHHYPDNCMIYGTPERFKEVYGEWFKNETEEEMYKLRKTANWVLMVFNRHCCFWRDEKLAMEAIPKFVEGWNTHYDYTTANPSQQTLNRLQIIYREGTWCHLDQHFIFQYEHLLKPVEATTSKKRVRKVIREEAENGIPSEGRIQEKKPVRRVRR